MKKICVFLVCCLLLCTAFNYPAYSDSNLNDAPDVDGTTDDEISMPYTPTGRIESVGEQTRTVIGAFDERQAVNSTQTPYCKIVFIRAFFTDGTVKRGSGVILGPDLVLTCAHLVYDAEHGGEADYCCVYTEVNGTRPDYDDGCESIIIVIPDEWTEGDTTGNDWAYMIVDEPIGYEQGWMGFGTTPTSYSEQYTISGYPSSAPYHNDNLNYTMYSESGLISPTSDGKMFTYTIDTTDGNSGSPVYSSGQIVYGIHVNGSSTVPANCNSATRISTDLYQELVNEKNDGIEYWEDYGY